MSILGLHADEMETAALNTRRDPYVAPRRSEWGGILSAAPRGIARKAAEWGASLADIGGAVATFRDTPSKQMERGGLPAAAFSSDLGDSVRAYWDSLKPDPLTATKTEQVLYGFARGAASITPATIAAGPVGALAAGVEEGMTVSDELRQQGVPEGARQLAGIVQGTGLASAALPLVGRTLGETAALYLAGGPGGFVAQQALTRKILENAGQDKIAGQYDPFDPVGLAVSALLPGFFTYRALKGQSAARAADANATAAKAKADFLEGPVPSAKTATAQAAEAYTRESVDAAMVQNLRDTESRAAAEVPARMAEAYRGPVTENPNFKAWFGDSKVVDAQGRPLVVYHGTTSDVSAFDVMGLSGANFGDKSAGFAFFTNKSHAYPDSASDYAEPGRAGGNVVPAYVAIKNPLIVSANGEFSAVFAFDKNHVAIREQMLAGRHDGVIVKYSDGSSDEMLVAATRPEQIKSAIGNSGRFDPNSASLTDPIPPSDQVPAPTRSPTQTAVTEAAPGTPAIPTTKAPEIPPDTPIRLDDSGNRVTFAADLAEVQRLAAEGTDDTLGTLDADLFRVAVECALSVG